MEIENEQSRETGNTSDSKMKRNCHTKNVSPIAAIIPAGNITYTIWSYNRKDYRDTKEPIRRRKSTKGQTIQWL